MSKSSRFAFAVCLLLSSPLFAAVFVVPDDRELVQKSAGIVIGVIVDGTAEARDGGHIETVYEVRVERALKGTFARGAVIKVVSPGGTLERRFTAVPGSAHFDKDDKVVLFLTSHDGRWTPTDMTLGKFRFVTSTGGQSLLVRDEEDIVGFDRQLNEHVERIRREAEFLEFIEETVRGREAQANYFVAPGETVSIPDAEKKRFNAVTNATYTARSYAIHFSGLGSQYPGRWPESRMSASTARQFFKNSAQSASGLPDGGVQMITDALNAWTNDCPSYVNIPYSGTNSLLKDGADGVNTVVWNDPGNHIAGSWQGSGVIATAFMAGDNFHSFAGDNDWVSISDADVVVQNGITGAEGFVATAMTHEIGHAIGLRHADTHFDGTACQVTDECTTTAIMRAAVVTAYNYTLQAWDQNAIRAIYPATCGSVPSAPTGLTATAVGSTSVQLNWVASLDTTSYKVFRRNAPGAYTQIASGVTDTSYTDNSAVTGIGYQYVVRSTNATGDSGDSNSDFTTAIAFTDAVASGVSIKATHFTELQTAVNGLRALAGLGSFSFATPAPASGVTALAAHMTGLRTALNEARTALGASAIGFGETISAGSTTIKASHITELRNGVF